MVYAGIVVLLLLLLSVGPTVEQKDCIHKVPGNFIIGGAYPVSKDCSFTYDGGSNNCSGIIDPLRSIESEAHFFYLNYYNEVKLKNTGIKLGTHITDTCYDPNIGYIRAAKITQGQGDAFCYAESGHNFSEQVSVVIGSFSSDVGQYLTKAMEIPCVPVIATMATADPLSNIFNNHFFLRVVPSDAFQAEAVNALIQHENLSEIAVVYQESFYSRSLFDNFKSLLQADQDYVFSALSKPLDSTQDVIGPCMLWDFEITHLDQPDYWKKAWNSHVKNVAKKPPKVMIVFLDYIRAKTFFQHLLTTMDLSETVVIGCDGWEAENEIITPNMKHIVAPSFTVEPDINFQEYLKELTYNRTRSPWLRQAILLDCGGNSVSCQEAKIPPSWITEEASMRGSLIREAMKDIAYALYDEHQEQCPGQNQFCLAMRNNLTGEVLLNRIKNQPETNFFNGTNSGMPLYTFRERHPDGSWDKIGTYNASGHQLAITFDLDFWKQASKTTRDECFPDCIHGYPVLNGRSCCWTCHTCSQFEYIKEVNNSKICDPCTPPKVPVGPRFLHCEAQVKYVKRQYPALIILVTVCSLGGICSIAFTAILLKHRNRPIVRHSGEETTIVLAIAVGLLFLSPLLLLLTPETGTCAIAWIGISISLTLSHAIVLIKARLSHRTVRKRVLRGKPTVTPWHYFHSVKSRYLAIAAITLADICIIGTWLCIKSPHLYYIRNTSEYLTDCSAMNEKETMMVIAVPILILFFTFPVVVSSLRLPRNVFQRTLSFRALVATVALTVDYSTLCPTGWLIDVKPDESDDSTNMNLKVVMTMIIVAVTGLIFTCCMIFPVIRVLLWEQKEDDETVLSKQLRKRAGLIIVETMEGKKSASGRHLEREQYHEELSDNMRSLGLEYDPAVSDDSSEEDAVARDAIANANKNRPLPPVPDNNDGVNHDEIQVEVHQVPVQ